MTYLVFSMFRKIRKLICLVISLNFFLFVLCSTSLPSANARKVYKGAKGSVRIIKMTKNDINILGKKLSHPSKVGIEEVKKAMRSLYYKEKILLTWGKKKPVFGKKISNRFAPLIQKALQKVKPHSKVGFSIYNSNEKTTGDIFAKNDTLIFKFELINGVSYIDDFDLKSETEAEIITNWQLIPGSDQQFFSHKSFLGIPRKQKTMIAAKLKTSAGEESSSIDALTKNKKPDRHDKRRSIEKKLRYLKDLKQQKLITENAYEKKVEELLDRL